MRCIFAATRMASGLGFSAEDQRDGGARRWDVRDNSRQFRGFTMRPSIKGLFALALLSSAAPAFAQEEAPPSDITVSGGVTLVSDYRFRGISFTAEDPAIQGTINLNHSSGLYGGVWASNLEDTPVFGGVEIDIYGGFKTEVAPGATLDVGLLYYYYPNGDNSLPTVPPTELNSDYFEPYVSLTGTLGPASVKVGAAYAWSQSALGDNDNIYLYSDVGIGIPDTPITLAGHIGYSDGSLAFGGSYWDWALGADVALGQGLTAGVRYIDTDLDDFTGIPAADTLYDATVLFSIGVSF
jgi:uncharacterized protein (TIGR02001 family)